MNKSLKFAIFSLLFLVLFTLVSAGPFSDANISGIGSGLIKEMVLNEIKDSINSNERALSLLGFIGEGKVNIVDEASTLTVGAIVKSGKISELQIGAYQEPNYIVSVSQSARTAIMLASDPSLEAKNQIQNGGIKITANGIVESIKLFILSILSMFS